MMDVAALAARAASVAKHRRAVIGVAGIPGSGKSTLARRLVAALEAGGVEAAYLPMDGFHLPSAELAARGLEDRKGAPETFDASGYVALLGEIRAGGRDVLAPEYDRALHDVVPGLLLIPQDARVVITEGNYLGVWPEVRPSLDELWFLDVPWEVARGRLIERRVATGRAKDDAIAWVDAVDATNARVVAATRELAHLVIGAARPHDGDG